MNRYQVHKTSQKQKVYLIPQNKVESDHVRPRTYLN